MLSLLGSLRGGSSFVTNSLRFRSSASANLSRTFGAATNNKIWTFSTWVKRGALSTDQRLLSSYDGSSAASGYIVFNADNTISVNTAATNQISTTTAVYRDPSAWYHIVVSVDMTAARQIIYANNVQVGSFAVTNVASQINGAYSHRIASSNTGTQLFDGYITDVNFIDGQALTPASFGAIDSSTGVWAPRPYSGTYGTNGFYLKFADASAATAAAIGKDSSGNGNNWTPSGISVTAGATYDSMIDVPVNYSDGGNGRGNYCVLSPISRFSTGGTLSNANLTCALLGSVGNNKPTLGASSGKWYAEFTINSLSGQTVDVALSSSSQDLNGTKLSANYCSNGQTYNYGSSTYVAYGSGWSTNDVIAVAWDLDVNQVTFYRNGASQGTLSVPSLGINASGGDVSFTINNSSAQNITFSANFGQRPFTYTPPAGFRALNTNNLPTPSIVNGANFMAATTYTGNAAARSLSNAVNSVSFQPNLVWIKSRTPGATNHALFDSVRGTTKYLSSNNPTNEQINANTLTAFGADGFSLGTDTTLVNANANSYVAWQWKAGGAAVSNTQGTITSQVSANTTAGFSVVTYTGTGANNPTVGHGLNVAPGLIFAKNRDTGSASTSWFVYHKDAGSGYYLTLNTTDQRFLISGTSSGALGTSPSSTTFTLQAGSANSSNLNEIAKNYVAYCFAEIAGFSRFGSYTGNGSADGPFVFCGFRPRWVMVKRTDTTGDWRVWDSARDTYNAAPNVLFPNLSNVEASSAASPIDVLSNGFKLRGTGGDPNTTGGTYIFAAFAEVPSKYALAR